MCRDTMRWWPYLGGTADCHHTHHRYTRSGGWRTSVHHRPRGQDSQGLTYCSSTARPHAQNPDLVGLGSYIVNAQGGCNDCHTNPSYTEGGDPFQGQSPVVNGEGYLAGGMRFGPFVSRNRTPCQDGKPAGLTLEEFIQGMRTGVDLKDDVLPPGDTRLLQVMPWPVYGLMTNCDLQAIYEYLRAIPPHAGCIPPGVQASDATP
jgi:hypothetical protein